MDEIEKKDASLQDEVLLENRYRIRRVLGEGGMSRVYLADATQLGVSVAIKENLQFSEEAQAQFKREARLLALDASRHGEAKAAYQNALNLNTSDASAHHGLGLVLLQSADYAEAEAAFQKAITLDTKNSRAYFSLGFCLSCEGRDVASVTY